MDFCGAASDEQFFDRATPSRHDLLGCGPPCNASMGPEASACSVLGHMGAAHHRGLQRACEGYIPSTSHICTAVYRAIWVDVVYNASTFLFCNVKWRNHKGRRTRKHERANLFQRRRIIVYSFHNRIREGLQTKRKEMKENQTVSPAKNWTELDVQVIWPTSSPKEL